MKNIFVLFIVFLSFVSNISIAWTVPAPVYPEAWVLVPAGGGTRMGWLHHPVIMNEFEPNFAAAGLSTTPSIIVDDAAFVTNPSGIGGLPTTFPGPKSLLGLSRCTTWTSNPTNGYKFYISTTLTVLGVRRHYLLRVFQAPSTSNFVVEYAVEVTSSFAPASAGWNFTHIESYGTDMYGLFTKGSQSYLIKFAIPVASGSTVPALIQYFWPSTIVNAIDIYSNIIHIVEFAASTYQTYDISTTTMNPPVSIGLSSTPSLLYYNDFIYYGDAYPLDYYRDDPYIYTYPNVPISTIAYFLSGSTIIGSYPLGFIVNDAGHQR